MTDLKTVVWKQIPFPENDQSANHLTGTTIPSLELPSTDGSGARGCTPQSCSFRDHADELARLGVHHLFGLSTQNIAYQQEASERLHLPFALFSDANLLIQSKRLYRV